MRKWHHSFKGVLTPAECAEICAYAATHPVIDATVGHGGTQKINSDLRRSSVRWLKRHDPTLANLYQLIEAYTNRANADFFGRDVRCFNDVQFTEYSASVEGKYGAHQDCCIAPEKDERPYDRLLSVCIQLSPKENYEGGQLQVNPHGTWIPAPDYAEVGDLIVFRSDLWHQVTPVTKGVRNSLVTWWLGPRN